MNVKKIPQKPTKNPSVTWGRNSGFLHFQFWFPPFPAPQSQTTHAPLPSMPLPWARLDKGSPPAASPAAAGPKGHTSSSQNTMAQPDRCWGHVWVLPHPLTQILMTFKVISDTFLLHERDQSSGVIR